MSTYFLAPNKTNPSGTIGNDNNVGTITAPFFSWTKLWSVLKPGDIAECRGGKYEYDKGMYLGNKNGTSAAPITIRAYQNELPVFTRSAAYPSTEQDLIFIESGSWFRFIKLEFSGFPQFQGKNAWPAFRMQEGSNNTFDQIVYKNNGAAMSLRGNSTGNLFTNCDFGRNMDPFSSPAYDGADGLDIHFIASGTTNTVRGCRFFWSCDDGLDLWENQGTVIVEGNLFFYNGYKDGTFTPAGNGCGLKLGERSGGITTKTLRIVNNNLFYKNAKFGIAENDCRCRVELTNNTVVQSGVIGFWTGAWPNSQGAVTVAKNNVSYKNPDDQFNGDSIQTNNSWQDGNIVTDGSFVSLDDTQLLKPRKADGSLPDLTFLKVTGVDLAGQGAVFGPGAVTPPPPPPTADVVIPCSIVYYDNLSLKRIAVSSFVQKSDGTYINGTKRDIIYYKDANGKWRFL